MDTLCELGANSSLSPHAEMGWTPLRSVCRQAQAPQTYSNTRHSHPKRGAQHWKQGPARGRAASRGADASTNPGVVSLRLQLSDLLLPLQELLPAHAEFFRQCCELLGNQDREAGLRADSCPASPAPHRGGAGRPLAVRMPVPLPGRRGQTTSPGPHRPP